jgi:hypothetical protein
MIPVSVIAGIIIFFSCASTKDTITVNHSNSGVKTDECSLQEELCGEARDFQGIYDTLPDEQKKDMNAALNSYIEQCEDAKRRCNDSKK